MNTLTRFAAFSALALGLSLSAANAQRLGGINHELLAGSQNLASENLVQVHRKHKRWKRYSRKHYRKHHRHAYRYHKKLRKKHRRHHRYHRSYGYKVYPGFVPFHHIPGRGARIIIYLH